MSIRLLAVELYKVLKEIEALEKRLVAEEPDATTRNALEQQLRGLRAERDRLRGLLEGAKA